VLLCLESVFSALFGIIFGMDTLTWRLVTGAALIFSGILIIEVWPSRRDAGGRGTGEGPGATPAVVTPGDALVPLTGSAAEPPR